MPAVSRKAVRLSRVTRRWSGPRRRYTSLPVGVARAPPRQLKGFTLVSMGDAFTGSDWDLVRARAATTAAQLRAKGATVRDFTPLPPVPRSQLNDFTRHTGLALPGDLADLLTAFAGGWEFYWSLRVNAVRPADKWLQPPAFVGNFGGNGEVPFIGATRKSTLLERYRAFQAEIRGAYRDNASMGETARGLFPLHIWDGGGGDYTALRLDVSPARVYYLDHEVGLVIDDDHALGSGFREFVLGWSHLGFPRCGYHRCWVNPATREPDDGGANASAWRAWLADVNAV